MSAESTSALDAFLADLRRKTQGMPRSTPLPPANASDLREVSEGTDLVAHFTAKAVAAGCDVRRAGEDAWHSAVLAILREHGARTVVVEADSGSALTDERVRELQTGLEAEGIRMVSRPDDETLFASNASVTGVAAAISETGTIVCVSGPAVARGTSLIPPVHVALMRADQIIGDLFDYFERCGPADPVPANINLISGPSKTADIEGILVTGVHGPEHVHIVVLD